MAELSPPGAFEECADELSDFVSTLERYPPALLAYALRAHLGGLLHALRVQGQWSAEEVATFIEEMGRESRED